MKKALIIKIALIGLVSAFLVAIAAVTMFIRIGGQVFQLTTGIYIVLCLLIKSWPMLIVGIIYGGLVDLINGAFIYIPFTIAINVIIYFMIHFIKKEWLKYLMFIVCSSMVFLYVPYVGLLNEWNPGIVSQELITDSIQFGVNIASSILLYLGLRNIKIFDRLF